MKVLVVYCHPCEESYVSAVKSSVISGLQEGGHEIRLIDLYAEDFRPQMNAEERRRYHDRGVNVETVSEHVDRVLWAEGIVFVYPTWWYGLPAMLKGWIDRVLVPHVAFTMPTEAQGIRGNLRNIRRMAVVTTCGASWLLSKFVGEPGRRTLLRGVRSICHPLCRTSYLALYKMDTVSAAARGAYLETVRARMRSLR